MKPIMIITVTIIMLLLVLIITTTTTTNNNNNNNNITKNNSSNNNMYTHVSVHASKANIVTNLQSRYKLVGRALATRTDSFSTVAVLVELLRRSGSANLARTIEYI